MNEASFSTLPTRWITIRELISRRGAARRGAMYRKMHVETINSPEYRRDF